MKNDSLEEEWMAPIAKLCVVLCGGKVKNNFGCQLACMEGERGRSWAQNVPQ